VTGHCALNAFSRRHLSESAMRHDMASNTRKHAALRHWHCSSEAVARAHRIKARDGLVRVALQVCPLARDAGCRDPYAPSALSLVTRTRREADNRAADCMRTQTQQTTSFRSMTPLMRELKHLIAPLRTPCPRLRLVCCPHVFNRPSLSTGMCLLCLPPNLFSMFFAQVCLFFWGSSD
jgi:hypothetical protein